MLQTAIVFGGLALLALIVLAVLFSPLFTRHGTDRMFGVLSVLVAAWAVALLVLVLRSPLVHMAFQR